VPALPFVPIESNVLLPRPDDGSSLNAIEATTALVAAQAALETAQAAVDAARLDLAATIADHEAALARADELRVLMTDAVETADGSTSTLAALVRAMVQGSDTTAIDALLGGRDAADLLARLGTADRLSSLAGNLSAIRDQVEADTERTSALQTALAAAEEAAAAMPVTEKQDALASAEAALADATAKLAVARENAGAAQFKPVETSGGSHIEETASQLAGIVGARLSSQGWATPVVGIITDGFGPRPDLPLPGVNAFHAGTDLGTACGSPIYAANTGVVLQTGRLGSYGNWVLIDHGDGISTGYAHIRDGATLVETGDTVEAGQVIAGVGNTGASTGCHLHLEVRVGGTTVDPQLFFARQGIALGAG
jgi:murein DD-endopeptidase MepM/ murein hydrolase activator NlpD